MGGAQLMLKWLRTGAWSKLTDVLTAIRQELQSVQPIDTASIRWEKDAEGMRAYYTGRTGGGEGLTVDEGGESAEDSCSGIVNVCFDAEEGTLNAFSLVELTGILNPEDIDQFHFDTTFTCRKLTSSSNKKYVVGVLQEALEAGEVGKCVVSGMTIAPVYFTAATATFKRAKVDYSRPNYFVAARDGEIKIITSGGVVKENNEGIPLGWWQESCTVLLGSGAAVPPSVLIRIGAKVDEFGAYSCTLFDNGLALPATGSGIAYALESSFGGELASGTVFIAHRAQVVVQDGEFYEDGEYVPGGEE